ncbi:MAG TPA: adenylyl-sulfate kinase [bacterium]|nr:adenylyl-sulfate kinase [bacterium]
MKDRVTDGMTGEVTEGLSEGFTVWFTGLPSSGKSTLAGLLAEALTGGGLRVETLDGDAVRTVLTKGLGFSREDRDENIRRIAWLSRLLNRHGVVAITAAISPYRAAREQARADIGRFVEVYVNCPLEVAMARDVKGLYARARRGEIAQFTGVSDPYEEPLTPEVVVQTDQESPRESLQKILGHLREAGWVREGMTPVALPTYLVERLQRRWGEAFELRVTDLLSREALGAEEGIQETERAQIMDRLRSLGYLD